MITLTDVTFRYPGEEDAALRDITLEIKEGQICGLIGPNGAGKSTLCYLISGMIPHYFKGSLSGTVISAGHNILTSSLGELTGVVGLVFQNPFNQISGSRFTVRGEVALGLENLGIPRAEMELRIRRALAQAGLTGLEDRPPYALSGGQQQRLAIASILVMEPKLLILDEPTSQLDPVGSREVFGLLQRLADEQNTTVLIAGHKLEFLAETADRIVVLDRGRILMDGEPHSVLTDSLIEEIHVQPTRFTQAARIALELGWVARGTPLPVSLDEAMDFFDDLSV